MKKRTYVIVFFLVLCQFVGYATDIYGDRDEGWKVGVASVVITPQQSMWLADYASRTHAAEGVLHDLKAKAIVFEDAKGLQSVLITSDLLGLPKAISDGIKKSLQEKYGFAREAVMLNSSHTHSGPVLLGSLVDVYPSTPMLLRKLADIPIGFKNRWLMPRMKL